MSSRMIRFSPWATLIGCVTLLVGLGWDALLHGSDPHLAAHEGIFTLSNPGHALFAAGIAIIVGGIVLFLAGHVLDQTPSGGQMAYLVLLVGVLILAFGAFAVAQASGGSMLNDDHHDTTNGPDIAAPTLGAGRKHASGNTSQAGAGLMVAQATNATATPVPTMPDMPGMSATIDGSNAMGTPTQMAPMPGMSDTSGAGMPGTSMPGMAGMHLDSCNGLPITDADRAAVAKLEQDVKTEAARFTDFNTVLSDGYKQTTAYVIPGTNGNWGPAHFLNMGYTTADIAAGQPINPAKPGALVYFRMPNGKMMLLGEMFIAPIGKGTCLGGGLTVWHSHSNLCFKTGTQQVAGNTDAQGNCPTGTTNHNTADMMHVWVFDNPDGPLAMDLTKQDYAAAYKQCLSGSPWCSAGN